MMDTARPCVISMLSLRSQLIHNVFMLLQSVQCCTEIISLIKRESEIRGKRTFQLEMLGLTGAASKEKNIN